MPQSLIDALNQTYQSWLDGIISDQELVYAFALHVEAHIKRG